MGFTQVVCPLLFFTDLTRNPYYTQIALLNICIAICGILWAWDVWKRNEWEIPKLPFALPLGLFLLIAFFSSLHSWFIHASLRPGITFESLRVWVFTIVNCVMAFFLPLVFTKPIEKSQWKSSIWVDLVLASIWGLMWFGFHSMKTADPSQPAWWDPYGAILWALGIVYALWRTRHGEALEFFHVIFAVATLASLYGVMQYFGRDVIWASLIQPYGGRPVSTFGNPNFLSSHLMLVSTLALAFALNSKGKEFFGFMLVAFLNALGVLSTLTRSTYLGLLASYLTLAILLFKKEQLKVVKWVALSGGAVILLILIFPYTPVGRDQSPLARFTEIFSAMKTGESYGPWHQRILIWSSAWDMVKERPLLGKGWGDFELFFPFYQGKFLFFDLFAKWRTHANNAHNILLEVWSQVGFIGTGFAIWLFTTIFAGGWVIFKKKTEGLSRYVCAAALAGFAGMLTDNFFGNVSIFFAVPAFMFWWIIGSLYNESSDILKVQRVLPEWGKPVLMLFGLICFLAAGYFVKRWNQERYYFQGFKAAKMDMVPDSIKNLEKAFGWFEGEVNSNYEMGNSYARYSRVMREKGRSKEAEDFNRKAKMAYRAALDANPGYDEIYFNLGITELQLNERENAIRDLEVSLFINPLLKDVYSALGNQYIVTSSQEAGKNDGESKEWMEKARKVFEQGAALFPKDKDMWNNLGYACSQLKLHEQALEAYQRAVQIDPSFEQGFKNLYLVSKTLGRDEPLLQVPQLIKNMESALGRNDYGQARRYAARLVDLMPQNPHARLSLGNILFYLGKKEEGVAELKKALELKPDFVQAYINIGKIYQSEGRSAEAKAILQKAQALDSGNAEIKTLLSQIQ